MKKYCGSLREHVMMIINFEKKKMTPLIKIQQESYEKDKNLPHSQKKFEHKYTNDKN